MRRRASVEWLKEDDGHDHDNDYGFTLTVVQLTIG